MGLGHCSRHISMSGRSGKSGTSWKYIAQGRVMLKAMNQMPTIIALARFFDICIFKGHQIARKLRNEKRKAISAEQTLMLENFSEIRYAFGPGVISESSACSLVDILYWKIFLGINFVKETRKSNCTSRGAFRVCLLGWHDVEDTISSSEWLRAHPSEKNERERR